MTELSSYIDKYAEFAIERKDGVLHLRFHSAGEAFCWSASAHRLLGDILQDIDADPENRVLLLSGTGADFLGSIDLPSFKGIGWDTITWEGKRYLSALLGLEIPVIAAVEGRCTIHAEIALLSDIVLASTTAEFGDVAHFPRSVVPGDGSHVLWTTLLGPNRGRYLILAEEVLKAKQAYDLGIVGEVLESAELMPRAWEHGRRLASKPSVVARNTKTALIKSLKAAFDENLAFGLALQGAAYGNRPHRGEVPVESDASDVKR